MKMIIIMVVGDNVNEMNDSLDLKLCAILIHTQSPYDLCMCTMAENLFRVFIESIDWMSERPTERANERISKRVITVNP